MSRRSKSCCAKLCHGGSNSTAPAITCQRAFSSHAGEPHPAAHRHTPASQPPWPLHEAHFEPSAVHVRPGHVSHSQCAPRQPRAQAQPRSVHVPCAEQPPHKSTSHSSPAQPPLHTHAPRSHRPWSRQRAWGHTRGHGLGHTHGLGLTAYGKVQGGSPPRTRRVAAHAAQGCSEAAAHRASRLRAVGALPARHARAQPADAAVGGGGVAGAVVGARQARRVAAGAAPA